MLRNACNKGLRLGLSVRSFSSTKNPSVLANVKPSFKVAVIGAAGGIGQPLSLLLKKNPYVKQLNLYDVAPVTPGVAVDLSHIPSPAEVRGFTGKDMNKALEGADVVIVPAGVPRKPGMTRDDLFSINAGIVANVAKGIAENCPKAQMLIISNPVNSTVPVAAEILKRMKVFDPKRVFGVTTLDELRALTFVRKALEAKNKLLRQKVTVIGGHAGITILPLLSQIEDSGLTESEIAALTQRIMFGGDEVVKAKEGGGSATLSMAAAGHEFASAVMFGLAGQPTTKAAYVYSDVCTDKEVTFFASLVKLGPEGVEKILAPGAMSAFEQQKYKELIPELKDSIKKGVAFGQAYKL